MGICQPVSNPKLEASAGTPNSAILFTFCDFENRISLFMQAKQQRSLY